MKIRNDIEGLLRSQPFLKTDSGEESVYSYAESMAKIENCLVVVSDLKSNRSRIFHSRFSDIMGLGDYSHESSIWEQEILDMLSDADREEKYLSELRFFNFLRKIPARRRSDYYLSTVLRFNVKGGSGVDVLHRMFYWYESDLEIIRYAICVYGALVFHLPAKSIVINSISGEKQELSSDNDGGILSKREKQVLALVETGITSQDIADRLCISKHTVSRHRQEILLKLQARNSAEAIHRAKQLKII